MFIVARENVHLIGRYRIKLVNKRSNSKYYREWQSGDIIELLFDLNLYIQDSYYSPPLTINNLTKNTSFTCNHNLLYNVSKCFEFEEINDV